MLLNEIALDRKWSQMLDLIDNDATETLAWIALLFKEIGTKPTWTTRITTCAVFPKNNKVYFIWNPEFFSNLSLKECLFCFMHEMLHIALGHLTRIKRKDSELWNLSTDAIINQCLKWNEIVNSAIYDGDISSDFLSKLVTFEALGVPNSDYTSEQLYDIIQAQRSRQPQKQEVSVSSKDGEGAGKSSGSGQDEDGKSKNDDKKKEKSSKGQDKSKEPDLKTLDNHDLDPDDRELLDELVSPTLKSQKFRRKFDAFFDRIGIGCRGGEGDIGYLSGIGNIGAAKELDTVRTKGRKSTKQFPIVEFMEKMTRGTLASGNESRWGQPHRLLTAFYPKLVLPVDIKKPNRKYRIRLFLDTSGSITAARHTAGYDLYEKFADLIDALPVSTSQAEVFTFDAPLFNREGIYPVKKSHGGYTFTGGGGTNFQQLEEHCKNSTNYPDAVIVVTDGMGGQIHECRYPKRWIWLITRPVCWGITGPGRVITDFANTPPGKLPILSSLN